ncbi:MAG: FtsX-like permease family protein [Cytophagaceae bacterium]|nr:FtsX-like permease family protein [Cytophagaceae bacterium]MDW8455438.1 FtsX-like permease family protein [Cytophagaceae bacterium]
MKNNLWKAIFLIAATHLLSRWRQSLISVLGVTFSIAAFVGMISLMTGINDFFEVLMLENTPHIHVYHEEHLNQKTVLAKVMNNTDELYVVKGIKPTHRERGIKNATEVLRLVRAQPEVYGASPLLSAQVFYQHGSIPLNGTLSGIEIEEYNKLFNLNAKIEQGRIEQLSGSAPALILGSGLAEKLGVKLYDYITLTAYNGIKINAMVACIYSTGVSSIDNSTSFASLATVQRILGKDKGYFTDINIRLYNIRDADGVSKRIQQLTQCRADDWKKINAEVLLGFTLRNILTVAVSFSLLIVAAFGIYNMLTMMMYEKIKDIAILKAIGYERRDLRRIFICEALLIGMVGGVSGIVFGILISYGLSNIPIQSVQLKTVTHLPVNFKILHYLLALTFALVTSFLAGWIPAVKASAIDPIETIKA